MKHISRKDIILLISILLIIVCTFILFKSHTSNGEQVIITINNKEYGTYSLKENKTIEIKENNKIVNKIIIKSNKVYMEEATCPDQICVNHKAISLNNEQIICLPHKVVITIDSNKGSDIDVTT